MSFKEQINIIKLKNKPSLYIIMYSFIKLFFYFFSSSLLVIILFFLFLQDIRIHIVNYTGQRIYNLQIFIEDLVYTNLDLQKNKTYDIKIQRKIGSYHIYYRFENQKKLLIASCGESNLSIDSKTYELEIVFLKKIGTAIPHFYLIKYRYPWLYRAKWEYCQINMEPWKRNPIYWIESLKFLMKDKDPTIRKKISILLEKFSRKSSPTKPNIIQKNK